MERIVAIHKIAYFVENCLFWLDRINSWWTR